MRLGKAGSFGRDRVRVDGPAAPLIVMADHEQEEDEGHESDAQGEFLHHAMSPGWVGAGGGEFRGQSSSSIEKRMNSQSESFLITPYAL